MILDAFGLLCSLGVVAFCSTGTKQSAYLYWLAGLVLGIIFINPAILALPWLPFVTIDPAQFSMLTFLVALWYMGNTRRMRIPLFMSGILTVLWISTLTIQGLPLFVASVFVIALTLLAIWATLHRTIYCNELIEEEAMGIIMVIAMLVAFVPEIVAGWDSAVNLQGGEIGSADTAGAMPVVLIISALFIILGAFYAQWKYK